MVSFYTDWFLLMLVDFIKRFSVIFSSRIHKAAYKIQPYLSPLKVQQSFINSGVEAKNSEVLTNTLATISCVVSGLTKQLDTVIWQKPGGTDTVTHDVEGYLIDVGTYNSGTKSQTTILTIPADKNTADSVYTCVITSNEHGKSSDPTSVNSNVFSKFLYL